MILRRAIPFPPELHNTTAELLNFPRRFGERGGRAEAASISRNQEAQDYSGNIYRRCLDVWLKTLANGKELQTDIKSKFDEAYLAEELRQRSKASNALKTMGNAI